MMMGQAGFFEKRAVRPGGRLLYRFYLDLAALAIELVERFSDAGGLGGVVRGKKPRAKARIADAPARVDPRPQDEAESIRRGRLVHARSIAERFEPHIVAIAEHLEPLHDERAIPP